MHLNQSDASSNNQSDIAARLAQLINNQEVLYGIVNDLTNRLIKQNNLIDQITQEEEDKKVGWQERLVALNRKEEEQDSQNILECTRVDQLVEEIRRQRNDLQGLIQLDNMDAIDNLVDIFKKSMNLSPVPNDEA